MMPPGMIDLREDESYRLEVRKLVRDLAHGNTVPKGDVVTPMKRLAEAGFQLAVLTNDSEESARSSLEEIGILSLFNPVIGADSGFGETGSARSAALPVGAWQRGIGGADDWRHGCRFRCCRNAGVADFIALRMIRNIVRMRM